ncbi:extracellular solute-binding protein [Paenibacillus sp. IB182496]|uniref:Extracellular solute-binding protein n=2 Tax=Paenibacillus sabuli TaxID=2772509 RepID=A0A927GRH9_9BACL|nr:extracellular solute-binding protein [Paenibacillus sabuli]
MIALAIACMLVLAACGGNNGASSGDGGGNAEGAEEPELRMLMQYSLFDPNEDYMAKAITEKTGFPVKYEMLPAENADEKLNLMVANKEDFDLMKLSAPQFFKLATAGALEPLDELIDSYGANVKAAIKEPSWQSSTIDGQIYAVPETGSGISIGEELIVRQDWMDELGLEAPTTPDELYTVLKTIKDEKGVIPLTGSKDAIFGDISAAFGIHNAWNETDGTLAHKAELPQMKDFLTYMNKLYSEGLLDSEMPINTTPKAIEKFSSGQAAMFRMAWWNAPGLVKALEQSAPESEIAVIPYLQSAEGAAEVGISTAITWYIAIPKASENKEAAMRFLDAKLADDVFKSLAIGEEGVHHEVKDGKYFPILPKFNDDLNNGSAYMTGTNEHTYPDYWQARVRKDPVLQHYYETFQANAEAAEIIIDPMSTAPPIDAVSRNTQKLNKLLTDAVIMFISGSRDIAEYDQFLEQWHAEGGAEMVASANEWYQSAGAGE